MKAEDIQAVVDRNIWKIEGWLRPEEAAMLARYAQGQRVIEVGAYHGRSTVAMAPFAKHIIVIDHFHPKCMGGGYDPDSEGVRAIFEKNTRRWAGKITVYEMFSEDAAKQEWSELGLLFIDGSHEYEVVRSDISLGKWVKKGGHVALHDCDWEQVKRAIDECLRASPNWKFVERTQDIVVFQRQ